MSNENIPGEEVGKIPDSANLALEYVIWLLERAGIKFKNGKTALYWHLIHTIITHIE